MLVSLIRQAVQERQRFFIIASLGLAIYIAAICWLYTIAVRMRAGEYILSEINRFLFWNADQTTSFTQDWFNLLGIAVTLPTAVVILSAILSNQLSLQSGSGSGVALLLSYPTTRTDIYLSLLLLQAAQLFILCTISAVFLMPGTWAVGAQIQAGRILGMGFSLWLLGLFFALGAFLAGNLFRNPLSGLAILAGLLLLAILIYLLPGFTHIPAWVRWFSPITPYLDGNPLAFGLNPLNMLVQAGWVIAVGLAAWLQFERVDFALDFPI